MPGIPRWSFLVLGGPIEDHQYWEKWVGGLTSVLKNPGSTAVLPGLFIILCKSGWFSESLIISLPMIRPPHPTDRTCSNQFVRRSCFVG